MKYKHLFWGIILISIGLMFLLANLGVLHFNWMTFWRIWPVILILWGVSILPVKDLYRFIMLIAVVIGAFIMINRMPDDIPFYWRWSEGDNGGLHLDISNEDDTTSYNFQDQKLVVPFDSLSTKGVLVLEAAAGNFTIDSSSTDLLAFSKTGDIGNYELTTKNEGTRREINLSMQEQHRHGRIRKNSVNISMNRQIPWDLDLDIGAAAMNMNLKNYKIDTAVIDAGAASVEITLGDLSPLTYVKIDAGASSFTFRIPKSSGCQVESESFLINRDFEGFVKKRDRVHQTENWNSSNSKIYIDLQTAVSSIKIERY